MKREHNAIPDLYEKTVVPEEIHRRILETCEALPERPAVTHCRRPLRITLSSAASLTAAFLLLCGVNAVNPVFAEGLPLVGSLFQQYNSEKKLAVGSNIDSYGKVEKVESVAAVSGELQLALKEIYSDGTFIHCAFQMNLPQEMDEKYHGIGLSLPVTVNGEAVPRYPNYGDPENADSFLYLEPQAEGYEGTLSIKLPKAVENGTKLSLAYTATKVTGYMADDGEEDLLRKGNFTGSWDATADTSNNRITGDFTGTGDVQILSVEQTPSETKVEYEIPYWGHIGYAAYWHPLLFLPDGTEIRSNGSEGNASEDIPPDAKTVRRTACFDGLPKGTETLILRFGHEYLLLSSASDRERAFYGPSKIMAELTVDLKDKYYTSTSTYLEDGMVSDQETLYTDYLKLSWFLPYSEPLIVKEYPGQRLYEEFFAIDELFQNDFALQRLNITKDGAIDMIWFKRGDDYKAVTLSLEKDGQLLAETSSGKDDQFANSSLAWVHGDTKRLYKDVAEDDAKERAAIDKSIAEKIPGQSYYSFRFKLEEGATVNFMDTVTLKLTDPESGEVLYSKDILLSNKEIFDLN